MEGLIAVKLRDSGQIYFYNPGNLTVKEGDYVIVEHDRGTDYGQVVTPGEGAPPAGNPRDPAKKIIRLTHEHDLKQIAENRVKAKEAFNACVKKIGEHKLDMK